MGLITGFDSWNPAFVIAFNDWEIAQVENLLISMQMERVTVELDKIIWKGSIGASFTVSEAFNSLALASVISFPTKGIWVLSARTKATFFAWESTWGKILTLNKLQRRG